MRTFFSSVITRSFLLGLTGLLICFFWVLPAPGAQYDYVDINNPALRKIPTAIPLFKPASQTSDEKEVSRKAADMLADMLVFTGFFKMLDRGSFLIDPYSPNIVVHDIKFKNWTGVGAELLVTGKVVLEAGVLSMELRLFDTFKGELLVGKRYKGRKDDLRRMIRRFSSEIIFVLTGKRGIFDSKIIFVSTVSGNKEIFTCDFDGKDPVRLTHNNSINLSPAWSSDGRWIAYTSYARNKPDLYIRQIGKKVGAVVSKKGINIAPSWVPGKLELAATLSFEGNPEIYLLTQTGKIIKRLTHSSGIDVSVSWSPDGKKMAFVSRRAGSPQIYIQEVASGQVRRLTFEGKNNTQPAWSPNGNRIAYTAMNRDGLNIRVIGLDGKGLAQMTHNSGDNESPSWSPDGSLIVFSSDREGTSRIYIMTAYGTDQRRLLKLAGRQSEPNWSGSIAAQ